ncbi:hypothetical protein OAL30_02630, partial [Akkermansiaceae bacterium]|nr:hypothetical protein [Akkermansiaceae bacterium]
MFGTVTVQGSSATFFAVISPEAYLYVDGPTFPNRVRPLAANYYETFIKYGQNEHNSSPWREITKVSDLLPGDILAWKSL